MSIHCCLINLNLVLPQLATHLVHRVFSGIGDMNIGNLFPSFRRLESSDFNGFLDTGLRRYDD
jgi:hypothetical protein